MEKTTMSVQELSVHMGISVPKVYELVKNGISNYQKRGKNPYFY
jgi:excisionase family DNA binding protein